MNQENSLGLIQISLAKFVDERGTLNVLDFQSHVDFKAVRLFTVSDTPENQSRGNHAHRWSSQLFVWLNGEIELIFKNKMDQQSIHFRNSEYAVFCPPGVWGEQRFITNQSKLLVLSDYPYDPNDYISNFEDL
jgi:dTDP-4-dehydrorhamnose 3,5-epimerase-like enzyme